MAKPVKNVPFLCYGWLSLVLGHYSSSTRSDILLILQHLAEYRPIHFRINSATFINSQVVSNHQSPGSTGSNTHLSHNTASTMLHR